MKSKYRNTTTGERSARMRLDFYLTADQAASALLVAMDDAGETPTIATVARLTNAEAEGFVRNAVFANGTNAFLDRRERQEGHWEDEDHVVPVSGASEGSCPLTDHGSYETVHLAAVKRLERLWGIA
jgi:hypothetical protein